MAEPLTDTLAVENHLKKEIMNEPIQIQPPERIGFSNLPPEILFLILEPLRPVYERPALHSKAFYGMPRLDHNVDPVFKRNLQRFADMRLLCVQLDGIISQMMYNEVVVFIDDKMDMGKVAAMFEGGAEHIRSVVVIGERTYRGWSWHSSQYSAKTASIIAEGLRRCTNIQNLECYHNHHTFTSRRWLSMMTPTFAPSVTSLVLYATKSGFDLSHALVGLGRTIQTLEILQWDGLDPNDRSTFHISTEIPKLSKLTLKGGHPPLDRVKKLFSRIHNKGTTNTSPLRSLAFIDVYFPVGRNFLDLLSINRIGAQLTSLRLLLRMRDMVFIPLIIKACPSLREFACTSDVGKDIFECLPPRLERLELAVARDCARAELMSRMELEIPIFFHDLKSYMDSRRASSLRSLLVHMKRCSPYSVDILPLNDLCAQLGVKLRWQISGSYGLLH